MQLTNSCPRCDFTPLADRTTAGDVERGVERGWCLRCCRDFEFADPASAPDCVPPAALERRRGHGFRHGTDGVSYRDGRGQGPGLQRPWRARPNDPRRAARLGVRAARVSLGYFATEAEALAAVREWRRAALDAEDDDGDGADGDGADVYPSPMVCAC